METWNRIWLHSNTSMIGNRSISVTPLCRRRRVGERRRGCNGLWVWLARGRWRDAAAAAIKDVRVRGDALTVSAPHCPTPHSRRGQRVPEFSTHLYDCSARRIRRTIAPRLLLVRSPTGDQGKISFLVLAILLILFLIVILYYI